MELAGNKILVMGQEWQSFAIWDDIRTLNADSEVLTNQIFNGSTVFKATKIYADFSQYPDNYWFDETWGIYVWAWFNTGEHSFGNFERYKIIQQTATYIVVEGEYGFPTYAGYNVHISRIRDHQVSWTIVGEGSNQNEIIAIVPDPFEPRISIHPYDSVQFENYQLTPGTS